MKKLVYTVVEIELVDRGYGDSWTKLYTFDLSEAKKCAEYEWNHLTDSEQKKRRITIEGWNVEEIGNAEDSFSQAMDELVSYPDADYYEVAYER